jgi:hypothetical protein
MDIIDLFMHTGQINQKQGQNTPEPEPEPEPEPQPPIPDLGTDYFEFTIKGNKFYIPIAGINGSASSYNQPYDWIIDWGDSSEGRIQEANGVSAEPGNVLELPLVHNYSGADTYTHTIRIYPNGEPVDGWFNAFGCSISSYTNYKSNSAKIVGLNTPIKENWRTMNNYAYHKMFSQAGIESIPEGFLPATTLANFCYKEMFSFCSKLKFIPSNLLPATTLKAQCYDMMFFYCTELENLPDNLLHVTSFVGVGGPYQSMFNHCTNLTNIGTMTLEWFQSVTTNQIGMFTDCPNITTPITYANIPTGWK